METAATPAHYFRQPGESDDNYWARMNALEEPGDKRVERLAKLILYWTQDDIGDARAAVRTILKALTPGPDNDDPVFAMFWAQAGKNGYSAYNGAVIYDGSADPRRGPHG